MPRRRLMRLWRRIRLLLDVTPQNCCSYRSGRTEHPAVVGTGRRAISPGSGLWVRNNFSAARSAGHHIVKTKLHMTPSTGAAPRIWSSRRDDKHEPPFMSKRCWVSCALDEVSTNYRRMADPLLFEHRANSPTSRCFLVENKPIAKVRAVQCSNSTSCASLPVRRPSSSSDHASINDASRRNDDASRVDSFQPS